MKQQVMSRDFFPTVARFGVLICGTIVAGGCSDGGAAPGGPGGEESDGGSAAVGGDGSIDMATGGGTAATGGATGTNSGGSGTDDPVTSSGGAPPVDCSAIEDHENWELCEAGQDFCTAVFSDAAGCAAVCAAAGLECAEVWENADGMCAADTSSPELSCSPPSGHQSDFCRCVGSGSVGTGGASSTGGASGSGGGDQGTGGSDPGGDLSIFDPVPGFASVAGGTTGGGTNLDGAIVVDSMSELSDAAKSEGAAIILVEPGEYVGTLTLASNKTIIGVAPGVKIQGNVRISGSDVSNVIVRNLAVHGNPCESYDECRAGDDAVYIGNGAHHVWLDHLDISDGQDGNCDVTQGGDYVTVSWSKFYYTYDKEHRFSNLIAGSDNEPNSVGKLRITYMNSWWGNLVDTRQPRGRYGNVHMLNNYHNTGGGQIHGVGKDMALIAENCVYNEDGSIWTDMGSPRGWKGIGNIGTGEDLNDSNGTVFEIPYDYAALPASQVVDAVTSTDCGAGNSCTFSY